MLAEFPQVNYHFPSQVNCPSQMSPDEFTNRLENLKYFFLKWNTQSFQNMPFGFWFSGRSSEILYGKNKWMSSSNWIFLERLELHWTVPVSEMCLWLVFFKLFCGNVGYNCEELFSVRPTKSGPTKKKFLRIRRNLSAYLKQLIYNIHVTICSYALHFLLWVKLSVFIYFPFI